MGTGDRYFQDLTARLRARDLGLPQVVVDLERVDRNIDRVRALLGQRKLRVAVKSLPCPQLITRVMQRGETDRLMVFDAGMLRQCVVLFPEADVLLGKPLPLAAVEWLLAEQRAGRADGMAGVRWLADTKPRVEQYADLARRQGARLRLAIELDVGMHRGGVASLDDLAPVMDTIAARAGELSFAGFMGYDAHAAKAPWPGRPATAMARASAAYAAFVRRARERWPALMAGDMVLNGSGSPTAPLLGPDSPIDEVALGSVLVKPSDFDLPGLEQMEPAAWIATPVLKDLPGIRLPYLEALGPLLGRGRRTLFIYGGRWMAKPVWPSGMHASRLYGLSSNQQFMSVPADAAVGVDDYVYFRPTQSEAMLDLFGALTVVQLGAVERWPAFEREAEFRVY